MLQPLFRSRRGRTFAITRLAYFCCDSAFEGKLASVVAFTRALVSVFSSSKVTRASFFSYDTSTLDTPLTLFKAFLIVMGQAGQVIPGTFRVTVFDAAQAGAERAARQITAMADFSLVIAKFPSFVNLVKEPSNVWINKRYEHKSRATPEQKLVNATRSRQCTDFPWVAKVCRTEYPSSREEQRQNRSDDEQRAIRFKNSQVPDPCAAKSQRNQNQRPKATRRGQYGR